jgi:intein/homing endonuclease
MADFFGFIRNAFSLKVKEKKAVSVVPQMSNDGAVTIDAGISSGGLITSFLPLLESGIYGTEAELISRYRMMSMDADCDRAISEVVNDAIVHEDNEGPTSINLDKTNFSDDVKKILTEEFEYICGLVNYNRDAHLLFRTNYIDGKSYFHIVVNQDNIKEGIQEIRFIDPRQIAKIREVSKDVSSTGVSVYKTEREYFVFNPVGLLNTPSSTNTMSTSGTILDVNSIIYVHSGKLDVRAQKIISHLDKAYRPWTKLREMEDSVVIYRLSRAPERRVFYIDIGDMQNIHVESHMREMMTKFKNKISYDSSDGGVNSQRRIQAMTEDFWIPRKGGSTATEIDTLPGGCLAMDTKVPLLDGRTLTIRDLADEYKQGKLNWSYSTNPETGEIVPGKISWAGVTHKSANVLKLTLDNGKEIICTPDHKFPIIGKGSVEAKDLLVGESLIAHNTKHAPIRSSKNNYEWIYQNHNKKWVSTHRMVAEYFRTKGEIYEMVFDPETSKLSKHVVHHLDFNRFNNSPENLRWMNTTDHMLYHGSLGFKTKEQQEQATELARLAFEKMKSDPVMWEQYTKELSKRSSSWWASLSTKERKSIRQKMQKGIKKHYQNLTGNDLEQHRIKCKKSGKLGNARTQDLLKTDPKFRKEFSKSIRNGWSKFKGTEKYKELCAAHSIRGKTRFSDKKFKDLVFEHQRIVLDKTILDAVVKICSGKTTHHTTIHDVTTELNQNKIILQHFIDINKDTHCANWNNDQFKHTHLYKLVKKFGYSGWKQFRKEVELYNHKIVSIEFLPQKIEVGTLTIDVDEQYHSFHNFALDVGVFTNNSNLGEIEDVNYFKKKFYNSLNVPTMRLDPENGFSIGRASEITREELKFSRFINQLRNSFATQFFNQPLRIQSILKNIVSEEDWEENESKIVYEWATDSYFSELKEAEIWRERLTLAKEAGVENPITEGYISKEFVKKNFFKLTEEELEEIGGDQNTEQLDQDDSPKELGFAGDQETVESGPESKESDEDFQDDSDESEESDEKEISVSDRDFEFLDVIDEDLDDDKQ